MPDESNETPVTWQSATLEPMKAQPGEQLGPQGVEPRYDGDVVSIAEAVTEHAPPATSETSGDAVADEPPPTEPAAEPPGSLDPVNEDPPPPSDDPPPAPPAPPLAAYEPPTFAINVPVLAAPSGYATCSFDVTLTGQQTEMLRDVTEGLRASGLTTITRSGAIGWMLDQLRSAAGL